MTPIPFIRVDIFNSYNINNKNGEWRVENKKEEVRTSKRTDNRLGLLSGEVLSVYEYFEGRCHEHWQLGRKWVSAGDQGFQAESDVWTVTVILVWRHSRKSQANTQPASRERERIREREDVWYAHDRCNIRRRRRRGRRRVGYGMWVIRRRRGRLFMEVEGEGGEGRMGVQSAYNVH